MTALADFGQIRRGHMALEEALADFLAFPVTQTGFPAIFRMEMEDTAAGILKAERTTIGDIFGSMFHGRGRENTKSRGQDITAQIEIPFDAAAFGGEQAVTLTAPDGSRKTFQVQIPAGIDEGQTIRLRGKGAPGTKGAEAGDLLLKVSLGSRPGFERRGKDIYTTAAIPFTTAVFGGEARVSTLYGDVLCKILPGTQSGSRIRLSGKGIVSSGVSSVRGDQYVSIQIAVPENLNREAAQKLHEFEAACRTGNGRGAA